MSQNKMDILIQELNERKDEETANKNEIKFIPASLLTEDEKDQLNLIRKQIKDNSTLDYDEKTILNSRLDEFHEFWYESMIAREETEERGKKYLQKISSDHTPEEILKLVKCEIVEIKKNTLNCGFGIQVKECIELSYDGYDGIPYHENAVLIWNNRGGFFICSAIEFKNHHKPE